MDLDNWLRLRTAKLLDAGIESARLDCLLLLEDKLKKDRSWLLAHPEMTLSDEHVASLDQSIARRSKHEPMAYIRGYSEFYGRIFHVTNSVLAPRPESESIITMLKRLQLPDAPVVIDVGTGSGALAVTASLELPDAKVYATDIDPACLAVAAGNAKQLGADCKLTKANLLESNLPMPACYVVLANLPYVPDAMAINAAAGHEPRHAIFGGEDGLDLYRQLADQVRAVSPSPVHILTESLLFQHAELAAIMAGAGYSLVASEGLAQAFQKT